MCLDLVAPGSSGKIGSGTSRTSVHCCDVIYVDLWILLERPCTCQRKKKRCYCFRPHRNENWLFSRYSTGWKCGLHADWTELTGCVDQELDKNEGETAKRRYFYITLLREPIARYLSEFRHVQRGATWKNARHWCLGRHATPDELPPCYNVTKSNDTPIYQTDP
uniref:Heparan-sulfate 6-O-sulfotransferase n=1 Tax=Anopheles minimus TaxID=112268 RepID=A0A182VYV3_9DIPT